MVATIRSRYSEMYGFGACSGDTAAQRLANSYDKGYSEVYNDDGQKRKEPVGLKRPQLQCYMNAVLQCLESSSVLCDELGRSGVQYAKEFINLTQRTEPVVADVLLGGMDPAKQADANEFLIKFIELSEAKTISAKGHWQWTCTNCRNRLNTERSDGLSVLVNIGTDGGLRHLLTSNASVRSCPTCKKDMKGTSAWVFDKPSPIMAITVDRASTGSGGLTKNPRPLKAEEKVFIDGNMYELFALVSHREDASDTKPGCGHYWAHVRRGGRWWHINDDVVQEAGLDTAAATLLFYSLHPLFAPRGEISLLRA